MDKRRIKAVIFILLFLLVMAVAVNLLLDMEKDKREVVHLPSESAAPAQTEAPTPTPVPATPAPTPAPTATPEPTRDPYIDTPATPVPTLQPLPTPEPTGTALPEGEELGTGTFRSETGVGLNVRAEWTAKVMDAKHVKVTMQIWLDSYSLHLIQVNNCVNVSVGESYVTANAPAVDIDDNGAHQTLLATTEHVVNLSDGESRSFPVQVEYQFGGTYQQQELPVIECGGAIELKR